jgi:hypothetical protein
MPDAMHSVSGFDRIEVATGLGAAGAGALVRN